MDTTADRLAAAEREVETTAATYANLPDGPDKDRAANAFSRAVTDRNLIRNSVASPN